MQIFIHRYDLLRSQKANAQTLNSVQVGALIKVVDENNNFGVADLCPWPSLGDSTLDVELLSRGVLFQNALRLAGLDLEARKNKIKLNNGHAVQNHFLISNYKEDNAEAFYGFVVKIKGDRDIDSLAHFLNVQAQNFKSVRLDFNGSLDVSRYEKFVAMLTPATKNKIECVEDPYPEKTVTQDLVIASDFLPFWKSKIIKPARAEVTEDFLYLTSSMDHPVGMAHGLVEAQKHPSVLHGFLTLNHYMPTAFHKYFKIQGHEISYQSDGYGIGFETELCQLSWKPLVHFDVDAENQIFYVPNNNLPEIKKYFDRKISANGYFLISSSGSSQSISSSLKVYAISIENFLNSARRVNQHYGLTSQMNWGCVLPTYHVGGLSILARAHLSEAEVFTSEWSNFSLEWITHNNIQLLSLVPTQLYDIVVKNMICPAAIKHVFIGGAHLSDELARQATVLGWPLSITFGMTETSSMFASRTLDSDLYVPYSDITVAMTKDSRLMVKSDALAEYVLQKVEENIILRPVLNEGWYVSEDMVELNHNRFKFTHRSFDQIKINGEGVSLLRLREKLENNILKLKFDLKSYALIALPDERRGEQIVLITSSFDDAQTSMLFEQFNQSVHSHEKIRKIITLKNKIPMTEMNKIKYAELKNLVLKEKNEST